MSSCGINYLFLETIQRSAVTAPSPLWAACTSGRMSVDFSIPQGPSTNILPSQKFLSTRKTQGNMPSPAESNQLSGPVGHNWPCLIRGHVWMWELDCEESQALKNWCFWTVVLEKTLESPLDCKEIQPVHPEGDQSWVFIGRTDVEAETLILWPPHAKSWLIGKEPDAGRDWEQEEKGTTEDEMAGWHHQLNGHEFE